jgi:hypothetical protein
VLPLGGLGEIGKNMTVIEFDGRIIVVDTGLMFPTAEMHGIDLSPDFSPPTLRATTSRHRAGTHATRITSEPCPTCCGSAAVGVTTAAATTARPSVLDEHKPATAARELPPARGLRPLPGSSSSHPH